MAHGQETGIGPLREDEVRTVWTGLVVSDWSSLWSRQSQGSTNILNIKSPPTHWETLIKINGMYWFIRSRQQPGLDRVFPTILPCVCHRVIKYCWQPDKPLYVLLVCIFCFVFFKLLSHWLIGDLWDLFNLWRSILPTAETWQLCICGLCV